MTYKKGSKGSKVEKIQERLNDLGFYCGKVDGDFGQKTTIALIAYQKSVGLTDDGQAGPKTLAKLELEDKIQGGKFDEAKIRSIVAASDLVAAKNRYNSTETVYNASKHVVVVAVRGYNLGSDGENDRRIYDDAHFIVTPDSVKMFEGNTDPNGWRKGSGTGSNKGMACLDTGVWFFAKGPHKGRPSFRQASEFTVIRDGRPDYKHTGFHAINWHSGGYNSTSSLGCQTNRPDDYNELRNYMYTQLEKWDNPKMKNDWSQKERAFPYILVENS